MKKYWAFFRMRFINGLQYRAAAWAGVVTQFVWGFMELFLFDAFYRADPSAFPMDQQALASYIWLQQAFFAMFTSWQWENELFDSIASGNVAYELCRPVSIYNMWFTRSAARRLSRAALRCLPVLLVASLLPTPYGMGLPDGPEAFAGFLISMVLGLLLVSAFSMLVYMSAFYTISSQGIRIVATNLMDFLCGAIIPLPFLPDAAQGILALLPFASMNNAPFRIYGGDIGGMEMAYTIGLQVFWTVVLVAVGKWMEQRVKQKIVVQGS